MYKLFVDGEGFLCEVLVYNKEVVKYPEGGDRRNLLKKYTINEPEGPSATKIQPYFQTYNPS